VVIKPEEIAWRRLAGQFLTVPGPAKPADVVRRLGAVQAQDYAGAKWALAQRTKAATDAAVDRAVDAGTIVRTHVLRPTWHFVAAEDLRWMLALTGPRISRALASYNRVLEITPAVIRRSHAAITKALEGGRHLTRAEVAAVLSRAKVGALTGHRFGRLVVQAELDAIICSGARRGKQSTYALLDERVTAARGFVRDTALAELARRYFPTRGPASAHDFAWWSGLTVADARRAVAILGRELEPIDVGGRPFWMSAGAKAPPRKPCAHLLPNYDEYFIGFVDRSAIGRRLGSVERVTGGNALLNHIATVNGQIVGGWKRTAAGPRVTLRFDLPSRLSRAERALLDREIGRYRAFAGGLVEVTGWRP